MRGDHIFVSATVAGIPFEHHGIDMGDGTVIHLAPEGGARITLRDTTDRFTVRRDVMEIFSRGKAVAQLSTPTACRSSKSLKTQKKCSAHPATICWTATANTSPITAAPADWKAVKSIWDSM